MRIRAKPFPCRRRHRRRRRRSAHPLHAAGQPRSGGARRHDFGRGAASRQRRRTCACASRFLLPRRRSGRCGTCGECPRACVARPFRNRRLGRCRNRNLRSRLPRGVGIDRRNPRRRGGEGRFHRPRCFDESIRRSAGKSRLRRPGSTGSSGTTAGPNRSPEPISKRTASPPVMCWRAACP